MTRALSVIGFVALTAVGCGDGGPGDSPAGPTVVTLVARPLALEQTCDVDLDAWIVSPPSVGTADVWFEAVKPGERYLTPENGARFVLAGASAPGFAGCQAAAVTATRIPLTSLTAGRYLCGLTNGNRVVELRIDEAAPEYVPGSGIAPVLKMTVTTFSVQ
jgi:hypothetical protein